MPKNSVTESSPQQRGQRLQQLRQRMRDRGLDAYVVRGTDRYLSEYVPVDESQRAWLSGFTGSVADLLITQAQAYIFVDGRYHLQAEQECDAEHFTVDKVPLGTSNEQALFAKIEQLAAQIDTLAVEPDRYSVAEFARLESCARRCHLDLVGLGASLVEELRGASAAVGGSLRVIDIGIAGSSVEDKLGELRQAMQRQGLDAWVVSALDEIAYLTNMRGDGIAFQSTFKAICVVTAEDLIVALPGRLRDPALHVSPALRFVDESQWAAALPPRCKCVGFDKNSATEAVRQQILARGAEAVAVDSPLPALKARKSPAELRHMRQAFAAADKAIWASQLWLHRRIDKGLATTEADLAADIARRFKRGGGTGLSFEVIAAAGANGAIIHYSDPDAETPIAAGSLVLLDTGSFYEGGYATDLTRTFVAGRKGVQATDRQKFLFTTVLQAAIAGMSARIPVGTAGSQLDALCRQHLWRHGLRYLHGTGHGVGINVHETPPRVSSVAHGAVEPGQVFSIEPGLYIEGEGGVRIENLVTAVEDPEHPGFMRIAPLTFSPLDARLIDTKRLSKHERAFVKWFKLQWRQGGDPDSPIRLPPVA